MNELIKRLCSLLTVKSLVTITLTIVFAVLAVTNSIAQDFMTIYAVIIAFYFGTQAQKVTSADTPSADEIAEAISTKFKIEVPINGEAGDGTE